MRHEGPGKVRLQTDPPRESDSSVWDGVLDALKSETGALSQKARTLVESHLSNAERDLLTLRTRVESDTELSDEQRSALLGSSKTALVMMSRLRRNGLGAMAVGEGTALAVENARDAQRTFERQFATHMQHATVRPESVETPAPAAPEFEASFEEVVDAAEARGANVAQRAGIVQEEIVVDAVVDGKGTRRGTKGGGNTRTRGQKKAKDTASTSGTATEEPVSFSAEIPKDALRDNQDSPYLAEEGTDGFMGISASLSESGESTSPLQVGTRVEPATDSSFRPSSRYTNRTASETVQSTEGTSAKPETKREPWWTKKPKTVHYSDEMKSARDALKNYDPNQDDVETISTPQNTNLRELFNKAPVDPLSPDTTAAEVRGALQSAVEYEARRTADAFNVITEEALAKDKYEDTSERAFARLEGRVAREKAENAYKQKDTEFARIEAEKKAAYFAELTKFQQNRGFLDAAGERMGLKQADQSKETAELKELKREWMRARLDRSRMRLDTVLERREARGASLSEADKEAKTLRADKVLERFQRRYLLREATSVAIAAANEESAVRAQALSDRDRHVVDKIFKFAKDHPKIMLGISTATTVGGVISTAGAGFALPAVAVALGALASLRHKYLAQGKADALKTESEKENVSAERLAQIRAEQAKYQARSSLTTMSGLSSLLAGGITKLLTGKDRARAERSIQGSRIELEDLRSENALAELEKLASSLDAAYAKLRQVDATIARNAMAAGMVGGFAGGAAVGALAPHESASTTIGGVGEFVHDKWNDLTDHESAPSTDAATSGGELKIETGTAQPANSVVAPAKLDAGAAGSDPQPVAVGKGPEVSDAVAPAGTVKAEIASTSVSAEPSTAEVTAAGGLSAPVVEGIAKVGTPEGLLVGATISQAGDGFGDMIVNLKHNFEDQLGSTIDTPKPALEYVLSSNANAITKAIGAAENGQSLTMHMGDQFAIDENQNIWFQPANGEPHLVIENVPVSAEHPQGFVIHKLDTDGDMRPDVVPTQPATTAAGSGSAEAPGTTATVEAPTPLTVEQNVVGITVDKNVELQPGLTVPENLDTRVPEEAAQVEAPKPPEVQAQTEAPKAPAPEVAAVQTPQYEVDSAPHLFADPDAGPLMNPNGVDLNKPQILMNEGRYWALGTSTEDSFDRASALSAELAKQPGAAADSSLTNVYFVARELNKLGVPYDVVKLVYTVPGSDPQTAGPEAPERMPGLPDASKFTLPAKR